MSYTILGGRGYVGSRLAKALSEAGCECWVPERGNKEIFSRPLGLVFYCIGLTGDFRSRPFDTIRAHVSVLTDILERAEVDRLVYLSSTRVYAGSITAEEVSNISVAPYHSDDLYNLSKLTGEALALASPCRCTVVRLSNVVGPDMDGNGFIGELLSEANAVGEIRLRSGLQSEKDYIWIDDAIRGLMAIAERGNEKIYNLASGKNVKHADIADLFRQRGIEVRVDNEACTHSFPPISMERLLADVGYLPDAALPKIAGLLDDELCASRRSQ